MESEISALRLQQAEFQKELSRLRQQHDDDQQLLNELRQQLPHSHPVATSSTVTAASSSSNDAATAAAVPTVGIVTEAAKKKKKKKKKKKNPNPENPNQPIVPQSNQQQRPQSNQQQRPQSNQRPPSNQQQHPEQQQHPDLTPTVHFYHDSNAKFIKSTDIQTCIDTINKKQNKQQTKYNIIMHPTYTLQTTLNQISNSTFNKNDHVIINILTNDARTTAYRPPKSFDNISNNLNSIYDHLLRHLSPNNITLLESPPLLFEDIFPRAALSFQLAKRRGIRSLPTLIGEGHLIQWTSRGRRDGIHVRDDCRHLMVKTIASAVLRQEPHQLFGLRRPPQGDFGPWLAPFGCGMAPPPPQTPSLAKIALAPPYHFRKRPILPLMDINIQRLY